MKKRSILKIKNKSNTKKCNLISGFTLLELLVVIAIIGILSSVVMVSMGNAKIKARDAKRVSDITQIQTAVELYYAKYGVYPGSSYGTARTGADPDGCGEPTPRSSYPIGYWCMFESDLVEFLPRLPRDPSGNQTTYIYNYKFNLNATLNPNNYYGIGFFPERPASFTLDRSGMVSFGPLPTYCANKYAGTNGQWTNWDGGNLCAGGN